MVEIEFNTKKLELTIKGHAEHGNKGEDIVCSAVSALFYTLAESLTQSVNMLEEEPKITVEDGNGKIKCKPKDEFNGNIIRSIWTILVGFELISQNYPENVKFLIQ